MRQTLPMKPDYLRKQFDNFDLAMSDDSLEKEEPLTTKLVTSNFQTNEITLTSSLNVLPVEKVAKNTNTYSKDES